MTAKRKTSPVQSVDRALAILEALADEGRDVGLKELSVMVALDASTTHRLLQTMMARGFVRQEEGGRKYALGLRAFEVGNAVVHVGHLRELVRPVLQSLTEKTEETSNLAVMDGWRGVYVEQQAGPHFLRMLTEVGRVIPLHCTAVGKVLLSGVSEEDLERFVQQKRLEACTTKSIVSPEDLAHELQWVRANGYAMDDEEFEAGAKCIAAPIRDRHDKIVAALSISGPSVRFTAERVNLFIPVVRKAASDFSRILGFRDIVNLGL